MALGALMYDPCIGQFVTVQEEYTAVPFALAQQANLGLNASFIKEMTAIHESCGYAAFIEKYLTFPPPGIQAPQLYKFSSPDVNLTCDVFDLIFEAAIDLNPCFNIYEVSQQCPILWDVLAFPGSLFYQYPGATVYFNRTDVKTALHAPLDVDWTECSNEPVFVGGLSGPETEGDTSADPIQHVLPQVIEATNRVLVANGDLDMVIITNGTLLAIQNMTWNGKLGFQTKPSTPINITLADLQYPAVFDANGAFYAGLDGPQGIMGIQHYERGLMWAETFLSGHMQPEFQPRVTYRHLQWVLGRINTL